jgi:hypothetical protein
MTEAADIRRGGYSRQWRMILTATAASANAKGGAYPQYSRDGADPCRQL